MTHEPVKRAGGRRGARRVALQGLYQHLLADTEASDLVLQFQAANRLQGCDKRYFDEMLRGVVGDRAALEATFAGFLDRAPSHLDPIEHAILLLAAWELRERAEVPVRVVINEALELAKDFGATEGHRYINGVLDRVARRLRAVELGDE